MRPTGASVRVFTNFSVQGFEDGVLTDRLGKIHRPGQLVTISPSTSAGNSLPGLPLDRRGFVRTEPSTCRVVGHEAIFCVGDSTGLSASRCVFVAMHQATAAATTVAQQIDATQERKEFIPCVVTSLEARGETLYFRSGGADEGGAEEMLEAEAVSESLRALFSWIWPTRVADCLPSSDSFPASLLADSIAGFEAVLP